MGIIRVENIKVYAYHGCLEEEARIGSKYRVDIKVEADLSTSAASDDLADTVDYVLLNKIAAEEMAIRAKLLETVAQRIITRIFKESSLVTQAEVSVTKLSPPIGGDVAAVTITLEELRN